MGTKIRRKTDLQNLKSNYFMFEIENKLNWTEML